MYIRDLSGGKRNVKYEDINGVVQLCREPPFIFQEFPSTIPTCTEFLSTAAKTSASSLDAASARGSSVAAITTTAKASPATSSSSAVVTSSTLPASPPDIASAPASSTTLTTAVLTTATIIPESSVKSIVSSVVGSSGSSIASVSISSSIVDSSISSSTLQVTASSFTQTASLAESTHPSSSITSSSTIASVVPIASSALAQVLPSQSTTVPEISADNSIITSTSHLSTDSKVAIITAIVLAALALVVGVLYILKRRKQIARAQRGANFGMLNGGENIDDGDGDETRLVMTSARRGMAQVELGPNGYPKDVKMENGSLLADVEGRVRPPLVTRQTPIITNGSTDIGAGESATIIGMAIPLGPSGTMNRGEHDFVALPMPPTIAVARTYSDSRSSQNSEKREERINALSMARTLSESPNSPTFPSTSAISTENNNSTPSPPPSSPPSRKITSSIIVEKLTGTIKSKTPNAKTNISSIHKNSNDPIPITPTSQNFPTTTTTKLFDHRAREIQLSKEGQELSALTQEYEAERMKREKERMSGTKKKGVGRDRKVEMRAPLDSGLVGGAW